MVRVPIVVHRALAIEAAEQGVSINRLVSANWLPDNLRSLTASLRSITKR